MRIPTILLALTLAVAATVASESLACGRHHEEKQAARKPVSIVSPELGKLTSFEVFSTEQHDFSAFRENIPYETVEYARTALQQNDRLHYESPGEGSLHFDCDNESCSRLRASVTRGANGPVVWQTVRQFRPNPLVDLKFLPDSRRFANQVIRQLADDYQAARQSAASSTNEEPVRIHPDKIQIPEEQ